jgi:HlyD family secretion protein
MRFSKWYLFVAIIIIAVAGSFYLYNNGRSSETSGGGPRYKEFVVTKGTFQTMVSANGVVGPIDRIEIKSKASGRINETPIEEGEFVKKGDLICRLDPTDIQAEVDQAQADLDIADAELKTAQNTFDRRLQLFDKSLISIEEKDQSGLALAQAKGKMVRARTSLNQANVRLSETIVKSPIDGIILQKYVEAGQIISSGISSVSGGTTIADIADMRYVYVEAGIDEIDVGKIRIGQKATVMAEAYPQLIFSGEIIRIAPEARVVQNVTLFDVIIQVENPEEKLKSGMNASVEITVVREEDVLLAPTMALSTPGGGMQGANMPGANMTRSNMGGANMPRDKSGSGGGRPGGDQKRNIRLAMVKEGDEFASREIEVGLSNFSETVVLSGLNEGDILGVPMVSRLKAENDRMAERIRSTNSFGTSSSSSQSRGR